MSTIDRTERVAPEREAGWDPAATVAVLDDDAAVALFQRATSPTPVPDLAEQCDLPLSTAYRKVEALVDAGLLDEVRPASANGSPPARYERAVDAVTVTLGDDLHVAGVRADAE